MYRVRVDTLVNGEKRYIAQVGNVYESGWWIMKQRDVIWSNIVCDKFINESDAILVILEHKKREDIKRGNEVESSEYKMID